MTRTFGPNGKAHRVLAIIARGPTLLEGIWREVGVLERPGPRRKVFYIVVGLEQEAFAEHLCGFWHITTAGQRALAQLNAGQSIVTDAPLQIRRFARPAA